MRPGMVVGASFVKTDSRANTQSAGLDWTTSTPATAGGASDVRTGYGGLSWETLPNAREFVNA